MMQSEMEKLLHFEDALSKRMVGQHAALTVVADAVRRSRTGMQDAKRPLGSFLFVGTTGVGKTELAKAVAEILFNDENQMKICRFYEGFAPFRVGGVRRRRGTQKTLTEFKIRIYVGLNK